MEHSIKLIYDKLMYVNEHSGDGAIIHEAGHLSGLIFNYNRLVEKETANPIMGADKLVYYVDKLMEYTKKGEEFLKQYGGNRIVVITSGCEPED